MNGPSPSDDLAARAWAWRRAGLPAVCDVLEPWEHGTVARASRYPDFWEYNVVLVEDRSTVAAAELVAFADEALAGLEHRRFDFQFAATADPLRGEFEELGWHALRLLWMRHEEPPPPTAAIEVEEVAYDEVAALRAAWYEEDYPGRDPGAFPAAAREVALSRGARVLATRDGGELTAFVQLEQLGAGAEVTQVYVDARHRGEGRGTAMTGAAIERAGDLDDLWICADDEDRPKQLYARLGFRPATTTMELTRLPKR